ncbi:hypothetical protein [Pseudovibrio denitrificans]|uniref:hypothetical protein n=1 Tax=Pseudovibrio denitrificans TaxID=258256 RepID=UPI0006D1E507|nr:hypothetical protein [Pseudovibrio denitrificans]
MRHPDPSVQWFARKLARVKSDIGQVKVTKGPGTTRSVGHLVVTRNSEHTVPHFWGLNDAMGMKEGDHVTFSNQFEVFLSRSGIQLAALASAQEPSPPSKSIILVEVEDPDQPDLTSGRYFNIIAAPGHELADFRNDTVFVAGILGRALGVNRDGYNELVENAFAGGSAVQFYSFRDLVDAATQKLIGLLKPLVDKLAKVFQDGTMPAELWDPDLMPKDFQKLISQLGVQLDSAIADKLKALEAIPRLAVVEEIRGWIGAGAISSFLDQLARIEDLWNDTLDFLTDAVVFVREAIPKSEDVIGTTIGYLCGLWDGVIQAAAGIFETVSLGLVLLKASIAARQNTAETAQFVTEAFDEIIQILSRIKWRKVWHMIEKDIWPLMSKFFDAAADSLAHTVTRSPATVGYYTGYMVYNIAETFFPPLKLMALLEQSKQLT